MIEIVLEWWWCQAVLVPKFRGHFGPGPGGKVSWVRSVSEPFVKSKLDECDIIFVDIGVTVNGEYYRDALLSGQWLLPVPMIFEVSGDIVIC